MTHQMHFLVRLVWEMGLCARIGLPYRKQWTIFFEILRARLNLVDIAHLGFISLALGGFLVVFATNLHKEVFLTELVKSKHEQIFVDDQIDIEYQRNLKLNIIHMPVLIYINEIYIKFIEK